MAAPRLIDSQKQELVDRYRQGETAQSLAVAYGCSPNTVSRVLKAAIDPEELAAIKKQSRSRSTAAPAAAPEPELAPAVAAEQPAPQELHSEPAAGAAAADVAAAEPDTDTDSDDSTDNTDDGVLAVDDADDFGDDGLDDADDDADAADDSELSDETQLVPVEMQALLPGLLPSSVYMLVDKTVELQPRPLREFSELGALPEEEQERQGLMLYTNQRVAKRHCGRSQRVIKVPDSGVLERRSSYLVAQGITRLVLEGGSLFAIPGT